jgi:hypothetical protein
MTPAPSYRPERSSLFRPVKPHGIIDEQLVLKLDRRGAVRGIDSRTRHHFDDTRRYVDALPLAPEQRHAIYEGNARRVFPGTLRN